MIIQIILITGFIVLLLVFLANPNSYQMRAWMKLICIGFTLLAIVTVLFPDSLNVVAHHVGVTRGADMLLYMLALAFIFVLVYDYVRSKHDQRRLVEVVRRLAILEAREEQHRNEHK